MFEMHSTLHFTQFLSLFSLILSLIGYKLECYGLATALIILAFSSFESSER